MKNLVILTGSGRAMNGGRAFDPEDKFKDVKEAVWFLILIGCILFFVTSCFKFKFFKVFESDQGHF